MKQELICVWIVAVILSGCAAAVAPDGEVASTEIRKHPSRAALILEPRKLHVMN